MIKHCCNTKQVPATTTTFNTSFSAIFSVIFAVIFAGGCDSTRDRDEYGELIYEVPEDIPGAEKPIVIKPLIEKAAAKNPPKSVRGPSKKKPPVQPSSQNSPPSKPGRKSIRKPGPKRPPGRKPADPTAKPGTNNRPAGRN